jgi:multidrug efflux pump subunit AcrA (membrane-fusion protein)
MLVYKSIKKRLAMSDKVKLGCSITVEEKKLLDSLTKKLQKSQGELIGELLRSYQNISARDALLSLPAFNLSGVEQTEVENALTNSNSQLDQVARDGLLQRSRYLNSIADKIAQLESMSDQQMQKATFKGAANFRIEQVISTIINHNDAQAEKSRKVCLTKGIVFKLTGSNRQTINKYFDEREVMIDDHNLKHDLTDADNRKGKGFSFEKLLGVE